MTREPPAYRIESHEALPSTSDHIAARAASGEPAGLAVIAARQTAGRGTQGLPWESPPGNLYLSLLLRPGGALREAPQWSLLAAVALADALADLLPDARAMALKWPNDVLLRGRKLAGILTEAEASTDGGLSWLALGFGVNLAHAPALPDRATACLADAGVAPPQPDIFAAMLLARLAHWQGVQAKSGFAPIRVAWLARGPVLEAPLRVRVAGGRTESGRFAGLADDGSLLLTGEGRMRMLSAGEVAT